MNAMNLRSIVIFILTVLCAAALWGVVAQGRQLSALRDEQKRLSTSNQAAESNTTESTTISSPTPEAPRELLQLRAEVARLSQQQRELAGARSENERLRSQLETRRTNNTAAGKLHGTPYLLASEAKWLGYSTPEDTIQSLLWALKNHNMEKFLEGLAPEDAQEVKNRVQNSNNHLDEAIEAFFKEEASPPGLEIIGREQVADDSVALRIRTLMPDARNGSADSSESLQFKRIGGQWKLSKTH